jgi:iron(III) transport system permease protein
MGRVVEPQPPDKASLGNGDLLRSRVLRDAPPLLWAAALLVAAISMSPLLYLIVRTSQLGETLFEILAQKRIWTVFIQTGLLTIAVTTTAVLLGVILAWITVRTDLPARSLITILVSLPLVLPSYISAFSLIVVLGPRGLLQGALEGFGVERLPSIYGFPGAWLALTLFTYPFVFLSVRAGFAGLDPSLEDAARCLGRGPWQTFRHVTLPQLKPSIHAGALLSALYTLSDFGAVTLLQFDSFTRAIYVQYTASLDRSVAAVLALMLALLTLLILGVEFRRPVRRRYYRSSAGTARRAARIALGKWKLPSLLFCMAVAAIGIGLPVLAITVWLIRGVVYGAGQLGVHGTVLLDSIFASSTGALITVVAAFPVVFLAARYPGRRTQSVERAAFVGHALPGIVVALALVFFSARYATRLYQSFALLMIAYQVRFLPLAIGALRSSMLQINPRLEEAARNLGHTPREVFLSIILPLARPGVLTAVALVFLSCMKELPATLLLGPTGFETLAMRIWNATEEAFFARAAVPSLLLVCVSAIGLSIVLSNEEKGVAA